MKTKRMPWEDLGVGPHGPPQDPLLVSTEQREALLQMLHHVFVDLRGTMYETPTKEYVAYVSQAGRALHNVPTWLAEGRFRSSDDYEYVMQQYKSNFGWKG